MKKEIFFWGGRGLFGIVSYFVNGVASWKINGKVTGYGILYNAKEFWKFENAKPKKCYS